jgi:STE24 endopeptidase
MAAETILAVYAGLFLLVFFWERFLDVLNLRHTARRRESPPEPALKVMAGPTFRRAVDYTLAKGRLGLVSSTVSAAFTLAVLGTGFLGTLERLVGRWRVEAPWAGPYLPGVFYLLLLSLIVSLMSLPFRLYAQFGIERRFGFNRMSLGLFAADRLKSLLLSAVLLTPLLVGLFWLMDRGNGLWWLYAFLLAAGFQLLLAILFPTVIAPLFNRFSPLPEGPLQEKIGALARRMGFRAGRIYVMDSSRRSGHSNAYFTGLGRVKRIVLFDTLLAGLGEDPIVAVLAHEIGHAKRRHVQKMIAVSLAGMLAGFFALGFLRGYPPVFRAFGLSGPSDYGLLVVAALLSGPLSALLNPLVSIWSRRHEYEADRVAAQETGGAAAMREALIRLSRDNLSNPIPHPWYSFYHYSHPTLLERLRALDGLMAGEPSGPPRSGIRRRSRPPRAEPGSAGRGSGPGLPPG